MLNAREIIFSKNELNNSLCNTCKHSCKCWYKDWDVCICVFRLVKYSYIHATTIFEKRQYEVKRENMGIWVIAKGGKVESCVTLLQSN